MNYAHGHLRVASSPLTFQVKSGQGSLQQALSLPIFPPPSPLEQDYHVPEGRPDP